MERLLTHVPEGPQGEAWSTAVRESLRLTEADDLRPFDRCVYDTETEQEAVVAIRDFVERLEEASPLLRDVADVVGDQVPSSPATGEFDLGDVALHRGLLLADGLLLRRDPAHPDGWCDKHEEVCYGEDREDLARWEHLDAIVPGFETTLRGLLAALDESLPTYAGHDNGAARLVNKDG